MDSNSTPNPTTTAPAMSTQPVPSVQPSQLSADSSSNQSTGWTAWAQNQLGNLFNSPNQGQPSASQSSAVSNQPSTSPSPPSASSTQHSALSTQQPAVDANGFPTDESYLREQGLNLVDLNRGYVEMQEQQAQLLQVLSDPQQRAQFFAEFDRGNGSTNGAPAAPATAERPNFPGGAPGQAQQVTQENLQGWYGQMRDAAAAGFPLDNLQASYDAWDTIPNDAWRALAGTLIQGDF